MLLRLSLRKRRFGRLVEDAIRDLPSPVLGQMFRQSSMPPLDALKTNASQLSAGRDEDGGRSVKVENKGGVEGSLDPIFGPYVKHQVNDFACPCSNKPSCDKNRQGVTLQVILQAAKVVDIADH